MLLRAAGWLAAGVVIVYVARNLGEGLRDLRTQPLPEHPRWGMVALSGGLFLVAHAVLVQTWRSVLACWDARLPFWSAARIWSVSNLGKYVPGKVWQIGAMSAMSRELGVSPIAASGSAILGTLVNVIAGFVVALLSGRALLETTRPGWGALATGIVVVAGGALLLAPLIIPRLAPFAARLAGRPLQTTLPVRAVVYSLVGNVIAWLLYGLAFQTLVIGILGSAAGGYLEYLAAYTLSYLFGYLAFFAPAGIGVREIVMKEVLVVAGLASAPQAALVTVSSRIWLTLLEVTPGFLFWALHRARRRSPTTDQSDVPT
jgi:glycosyltransferase 2 family protein